MEDEPAPEEAEGMEEQRALVWDDQNVSFLCPFVLLPLFSFFLFVWRNGEKEEGKPH